MSSGQKLPYEIDAQENCLTVRGPQSQEGWEAIFALMRERRIAGLKADGITDAAMKGLSHLGELRRFQCCWASGISDAGVVNLEGCHRLESVNLMGTETGDGLIRAMAGKPLLRHLKTGRCVSDAGIRLLHQIPAFKNWLGGEIRLGLMSAEAQPNHLLVDGPFTDAGLADLVGLEGIFGLSLFWHSEGFSSAGLAHLRGLPRLGFLGCEGARCDDEAMREIAAMPQLRMLMGQRAVASDVGWEALSQSESIEYIWGRECPNLTGRGFSKLAEMPVLRGLGVSCKNVDDASLALLPSFPALREIVTMDVNDAGFRHVGRCEKLERLWCMYCRDTGDAATEHIAGLRHLKSYYAGKTQITDTSLEILSRMQSLEEVELKGCSRVTENGVAHLAGVLSARGGCVTYSQ